MTDLLGKDFLTLPFTRERDIGPFADDDNRYPESLVRHMLDRYTKPGDKVLDPFAGLGTTLFVAEEMQRVPYGIEADRERYEWTAGQLDHWQHVVFGDSAQIGDFKAAHSWPKMDLIMTSPPYMPVEDQWNPLFAGDPDKSGYERYIRQMGHIFTELAAVLKRDRHFVVQVDNLRGRRFTPLVRNIGQAAAQIFRPVDEIIVKWDPAPDGYPYTHCLVFKNTRK